MFLDNFINVFQVFLLVFMRLIGLFTTAPFFSGVAMPVRFRLVLGFFTSLLAVPLVIGMKLVDPNSIVSLADLGVKLLSNFVTGAGIGLFLFMIIASFQVSAQIFSIQMGLGMNEIYDPISDTQVPAIGNVLGVLVLLLLIRADGHIYMLQLITDSFKSLDLISLQNSGMILKGFISALMIMFEIALKIALPIIGLTIVMDVAMGILSRVAPQFNVMIMGFNLKLMVGFVALWLILPSLIDLGDTMIHQLVQNANDWIRFMKPV